jgi:putative nucleotidyltransferase with HDIG domain
MIPGRDGGPSPIRCEERLLSGFVKRLFGSSKGSPVPAESADEFVPTPPSVTGAPVAAEPVPAPRVPRTPASDEAAKAFAASIRHLPLFSGTATQLMRTIGDEDASGRELSRLITTDAALVAHLLRIANSPFYGFANRIATVPDALTVMGGTAVRRIVTASVLQRPLMSYLHDTDVVHAFWRHELMCAALAQHLAQTVGIDGEMAYMAGLMHDVGRLALLIQFPENIDVLLPAERDSHGGGPDLETACFGFDHAQAGGALLDLWGLPEPIVDACRLHVDTHAPKDPLAACVWLANRAAHEMIEQAEDDDTEAPWMVRIRLDHDQRHRILDEIRAFESG